MTSIRALLPPRWCLDYLPFRDLVAAVAEEDLAAARSVAALQLLSSLSSATTGICTKFLSE